MVALDSDAANQIAIDLGCRTSSLPFLYIGIPLRSRVLDCNRWNHVIEIFRSKLVIWKTMHISLGGRLTLIMFVLNSIPIYALYVRILFVHVYNTLNRLISLFL